MCLRSSEYVLFDSKTVYIQSSNNSLPMYRLCQNKTNARDLGPPLVLNFGRIRQHELQYVKKIIGHHSNRTTSDIMNLVTKKNTRPCREVSERTMGNGTPTRVPVTRHLCPRAKCVRGVNETRFKAGMGIGYDST